MRALDLIPVSALFAACTGSIGDPGTNPYRGANADPGTNPGQGGGAGGKAGGMAGGTGGGGPPSAEVCTTTVTPGPSPLRRLTRWEYNNTVAVLLGATDQPANDFVPEAIQLGFDNNADGATVSGVLVAQHEEAASKLARAAVANLTGLLGCNPAMRGEDTCAAEFIPTFGRRALRHTLSPSEVARYTAFYAKRRQASSFAEAIELTVRAMLLSPWFLYRPELGASDPAAAGALRLTGYEVASRLSYLFWGTMPDDALLDAAARGKLATRADVRGSAERLLADDRGQRAVKNFYAQWARLPLLSSLSRGVAFTPAVAALQRQETETFVDDVVRRGDGLWSTLLTAPHTFVNAALGTFYGLAGAPKGDAFQKLALDGSRYAGLLTQGSLMTLLSHPGQTSPVLRGQFVREKILCEPPLAPPDNVDTTVPAPDPKTSPREQLERKTQTVQPCKACHDILNPPGFAFDHFDWTGRWRNTDHDSLAIDTRGTLVGTDVDGPFPDHVGLAARLATSRRSRECAVTQWFRYAYGRDHGPADECTMGELRALFESGRGDIRALVLALVGTEAFLYRAPLGGAP